MNHYHKITNSKSEFTIFIDFSNRVVNIYTKLTNIEVTSLLSRSICPPLKIFDLISFQCFFIFHTNWFGYQLKNFMSTKIHNYNKNSSTTTTIIIRTTPQRYHSFKTTDQKILSWIFSKTTITKPIFHLFNNKKSVIPLLFRTNMQ